AQVNTFHELEPWRSYLIYATEPITPYLSVVSSAGSGFLPFLPVPDAPPAGALESVLGLSPATIYGVVHLPEGTPPDGAFTVTVATGNDPTAPACAATSATVRADGTFFYRLKVPRVSACGLPGAALALQVQDAQGAVFAVDEARPRGRSDLQWDNSRATRVDLRVTP
ncbi:MAG: hypothetical protein KDE20_27020, partial [Caldilineaceae bacterium]|nr:hypothetical protein [Caldilineaceae bacterium]